jgi:hypothetical protein
MSEYNYQLKPGHVPTPITTIEELMANNDHLSRQDREKLRRWGEKIFAGDTVEEKEEEDE